MGEAQRDIPRFQEQVGHSSSVLIDQILLLPMGGYITTVQVYPGASTILMPFSSKKTLLQHRFVACEIAVSLLLTSLF